MVIRNYVGARYVPKFADHVEWQANTSYEAMVIVTYNNSSYTSKVPVPPTVGNPAENSAYWALTGNYNAQVEEYRKAVANAQEDINELKPKTETNTNDINELQTDLTNEVSRATNRENIIDKRISNIVAQSGYVTPEMFGAIGDGVADDTNAVRIALKHSIDNGIKLLLPNTYFITSSLLTSEDYQNYITVNIEGTKPLKNDIYSVDLYGGIKFKNGLNLFDGLSIKGSIYRVSFMPVSRTQTGSIFHECNLNAFSFEHCSVSNILAFCHNTALNDTSQILFNRFLTVYYFAKCDSENEPYMCTDSIIAYNYINGGIELNNNHCFEWTYFNGSTIANNFIDYYQTIYYPNKLNSDNFTFEGGISVGNQYQVFRYLYFIPKNVSTFLFSSDSDCFNWTNETSLDKLANFAKYTYVGHDGSNHVYPPYILMAAEQTNVSIKNAIIQDHCKNIVFIAAGLGNYKNRKAEFTGVYQNDLDDYDTSVTHADSIYTDGDYKMNQIKIPFIKDVDSLPSVVESWGDYYIGELVRYNNRIYKLLYLYNQTNSTWNKQWVDVTEQM